MKRQSDIFFRKPTTRPYRVFILLILILSAIWLIRQLEQGEIKHPFAPTPTPTRVSQSYALEGDAQFAAGQLEAAITAYQEATRVDPNDAEVWAKLARIQIYSSALLTTDEEQRDRLQEGLASATQAVDLASDESMPHAIRAFALDWNSNRILFGEDQAADYLLEAEQEAVRALQLDNQNALALVFYAEILVDEQKWNQAEQYVLQALEIDDGIMDVHRVYAYVLETFGQYNQAIQEYDKALEISPNLTFLHLRAGANYRRLAFGSLNDESRTQLYEKSLEYFAKAARLNEQLGIEDPIPYLSIAKTYSQEGEYFIAARNVQKALEISPANADIYGQLGIVFFKSRNYEGSIPALKCAIRGCTAEESCDGRGGCGPKDEPAAVEGLPLSANTVVYYYTYGSVLAALSRPQENYCEEAMKIMREVKAEFGENRDIMSIVQAGESICQSLE